MDEYSELKNRLVLLEYHQKLLITMIHDSHHDFDKLVIMEGISEKEVSEFFSLCRNLCEKMDEQKAEGFVTFHPLFIEFIKLVPKKFPVKEVIQACLNQKLFHPLFSELIKWV